MQNPLLDCCANCETPFRRSAKPGRPSKYCSEVCRRQFAVKRSAKWQKANPERTAAIRAKTWKQYYEKHREQQIARTAEYMHAHPEWKRARNAARYALTRGAPTAERFTLNEIFKRDGGICHLCKKRVPRDQATMDHLIPAALGGPHTRANIALAHRSCNSSKKTSPRGEQLRLIG